MATTAEREALLAVSCGWCSAKPGEECHNGTKARRPITSMDGNAHDTRWRAATGHAGVVTLERPIESAPVPTTRPDREPVSVGAAMPVMDRPW